MALTKKNYCIIGIILGHFVKGLKVLDSILIIQWKTMNLNTKM